MIKTNHKENTEIIQILFLFVLSVISVYHFPPSLNKVFFLIVLTMFSFSKKNYFWFTFFLLISAEPFLLFGGHAAEQIHRIPEYNFFGKYGLLFNELFLLILLIKAKFAHSRPLSIYRIEYLIILALVIFLLLSSFVYGIEFKSFIGYFRKLLYLTLFYSIPRLITSKDFIFVFKLFIIFTFLGLASQIIFTVSGFNLTDFITGLNKSEKFARGGTVRAYTSAFAQFFVFVFGLAFLTMRTTPINRKLILYAVVAAYVSIFLTGTRGWIIAFSIGAIYYLYFIVKNKSKIFNYAIVAIIFLISVLIIFPESLDPFQRVIGRMGTIGELAQGDATAGGTLSRLTVRLPKVLIGIEQNPIVGWGFSKKFALFEDEHVGWANQVLQMGIVGLLVFIYFWIRFWSKNVNISRSLSIENNFKHSLPTLNIGLLVLLLIHSTSRTMFNFSMGSSFIALISIYFIFSELWVSRAILEENNSL